MYLVVDLRRTDWRLEFSHYTEVIELDFKGVFMKAKVTLLVLCLGFIGSILVGTHSVRAQESPKSIQVVARRFAFEPAEITVKKGQPVVLVRVRVGDGIHQCHRNGSRHSGQCLCNWRRHAR